MNLTFEEALNELEKLNMQLSEDKLPLEEALRIFEKGIGLTALCTEKLNAAEKKVEILLSNQEKKPFVYQEER